jgi:UDP-N-acetylglucosamine 2-epimerase (non-hydrolysing)
VKIISVVGARPNFMKIAPFIRAIEENNNLFTDEKIEHILVHTGQHYDNRMSKLFFEQLNIPEPNINLGVGSGTHAEQVGKTMIEFEKVLKKEKPDWVVVVGDVNATLACSVTTKKENIKLCHIEAGLRSGDTSMPEEINRLVTDRLSDLLLTPDRISMENLKKEGIPSNRIRFVGNIMIDSLESNFEKAATLSISNIIKENILSPKGLNNGILFPTSDFAVVTIHRPSNVDNPDVLMKITNFLIEDVSSRLKLIWSIHPRTIKQLEKTEFIKTILSSKNIILLHPLDYLSMLHLNMKAKFFITDSGGLQEECTVLGTPCITLRYSTERPITLKEYGGLSVLVGNDIKKLKIELESTIKQTRKPSRPELWDGKTAERCVDTIINYNYLNI